MENEKNAAAVRTPSETGAVRNTASDEAGCEPTNHTVATDGDELTQERQARGDDLRVFCERCNRLFSSDDIQQGHPICCKCRGEMVEKHRRQV